MLRGVQPFSQAELILEYLAAVSKFVIHVASTHNQTSKQLLVAAFIHSGGEDAFFSSED